MNKLVSPEIFSIKQKYIELYAKGQSLKVLNSLKSGATTIKEIMYLSGISRLQAENAINRLEEILSYKDEWWFGLDKHVANKINDVISIGTKTQAKELIESGRIKPVYNTVRLDNNVIHGLGITGFRKLVTFSGANVTVIPTDSEISNAIKVLESSGYKVTKI